MAAPDWIEPILKAAFGEDLASWEVADGKTMDFSGASILELRCTYKPGSKSAGKPELLVVKMAQKMTTTLKADASEGERLRAERWDVSYGSECVFITTHYAALKQDAEVQVLEPLHVSNGDTDGSASGYVMLMESLSPKAGWQQFITLPSGDGNATGAALRWLARFHAAFMPKGAGGHGLPLNTTGMWDYGRHTALHMRPAYELEKLPDTLKAFADAFEGEDAYFASEGAKTLGKRLQAVAKDVAWHLHPDLGTPEKRGGAKMATMCHGDYKQANMFFKPDENGSSAPQICLIDWQWTGPGVGATDLYYLCAQALSDESVEAWEDRVLRPYHDGLKTALNANDSYTYDDLLRDFKLSAMDFLRWLSGARLGGFTPEKLAANALPEKVDINRGIWSRSVVRIKWLYQRAEEAVEEAEQGRLYTSGAP
eukprot:TRINITY_DN51170_c0_g1_i1.p1 TRINITY_DN51170_c0_g1~~TRINITY_DN51170_c0_g1_i1.p1  ORF type:complete len:426 (-),score=60.19 TRINITY_DN51170_c0_g1_i1:171-1448(-)